MRVFSQSVNILYLVLFIRIYLCGCDSSHPLSNRHSNGIDYIYDLSIDPYENDDQAQSQSYLNRLSFFEYRSNYWRSVAVSSPEPTSSGQSDTWNRIGGLGPWLTSEYESIPIKQRYSYKNAPNIVFVLIDDWGYNDVGLRSTYLDWTTPTFDKLAQESILLENYYTYEICTPSRAALLTGRYTLRYGINSIANELPVDEITLAQELKSAGYRNYIVGKWHVGFSTTQHLPLSRGFDYFYGFLGGMEDYYTKINSEYSQPYFDLRENTEFVKDARATSSSMHSAYLFQNQVEKVIKDHATLHSDKPMFLYYSMQLIHLPFIAPDIYLKRCKKPTTKTLSDSQTSDLQNYCALNIMMDEALANLTCTLKQYGFEDNTLLIISGDNGGAPTINGNSYPFRGNKGTIYRGGVSNTAIIHGSMIPKSRRGKTYSGQVHITDWLPTLMGRATGGLWAGSYTGAEIDGRDVWPAIINGTSASPHREIVFYIANDSAVIQYDMVKYINGFPPISVYTPDYIWTSDLNPKSSHKQCDISKRLSRRVIENNIKEYKATINKHSSYLLRLFSLSFEILVVASVITFGALSIARMNRNDREFMMIQLVHEAAKNENLGDDDEEDLNDDEYDYENNELSSLKTGYQP